ncbi:YceI family protein [Jannaschia aquimarina]|uniref:YceI_1 protein n=1 Tax=Jannaschia aquimarina TaxID=935700 RepID=A0A0D1DDJ7_9RHOB|nr:YceI family protein [Jannaschia aquimarina]KIT18068.1 Protein YceI [Jannaschia aquimarina]SNS89690.1 Polyisoprenoid-binding protein YceI [Jannaschia aquimarina]
MFRLTAAAAVLIAAPALAEPVAYEVDASHAQTIFSYDHLGYSTTWGMFSGWEGTINFDAENPENSSVEVSIPATAMFTGWEARDEHFSSDDFLDVAANDVVRFVSTGIEVTGDNTATITGDLTLGGVTQSITLDTTMTQMGEHPQNGRPWIGFNAETTLLRSDFDAGAFAPFVSDEVQVQISLEAGQPEA